MKKILIIEDEHTLADLYMKRFEPAGYEVMTSNTIEVAKDIIQTYTPDLILVDHHLHGKEASGLAFIPTLRSSFPQAKIVMLSNYGEGDLAEKAKKAGANDFLVKLNTPPRYMLEYIKNLLG